MLHLIWVAVVTPRLAATMHLAISGCGCGEHGYTCLSWGTGRTGMLNVSGWGSRMLTGMGAASASAAPLLSSRATPGQWLYVGGGEVRRVTVTVVAAADYAGGA